MNEPTVIRSEDGFHAETLALATQWGISIDRCNIEGCSNAPTTILIHPDVPTHSHGFMMCEECWQEFSAEQGDKKLKLSWEPIERQEAD